MNRAIKPIASVIKYRESSATEAAQWGTQKTDLATLKRLAGIKR